MPVLNVDSQGKATLGEDVLKHLGVKPGDKLTLELLPGGNATLAAEIKASTPSTPKDGESS